MTDVADAGDETIQGGPEDKGEIELDLRNLDRDSPREGNIRPVEDTRAKIAFALLGILALVLLGLMLLLWFQRVTVEEFVKLLGVLLAPLVGLVGAATGYYYGRNS